MMLRGLTLLLATAGLASCLIGPRAAELDPKQATAIDLVAVGGVRTFCPAGRPVQLRAVVSTSDGKRLATAADGESVEGRLTFDRFEWSSTFGSIDRRGRLQVPGDPFASLDRAVTIEARVVGRPELAARVELGSAFDCGASLATDGGGGAHGGHGAPGDGGASGQNAETNRSATAGRAGGDGRPGGAGDSGEGGGDLEIALTYVDGGRHGRLVLARAGGRAFLFDPRGPGLVATANGGDGGGGGRGGPGGSGGAGGSSFVEGGGDGGNGGDGGHGGAGGDGGDGGDGGRITVWFDGRYPELAGLVQVSNVGGRAGGGGAGGDGGGPGSGGTSSRGRPGQVGRRGEPGPSGGDGRRGRDGPPVDARPGDVDILFAREIAQGQPIDTR